MSFADLFKKFRLKSEFATLAELAFVLEKEGYHTEDSTLSRWQNGERIPRDRILLITLIQLFIARGGITTLKEANQLLESASQGYLTDSELNLFPKYLLPSIPFQVPQEIDCFVGREQYVERLLSLIRSNNMVIIQGQAGVGKTALAIKLAHLLRHEFFDGVLWFRLDTTNAFNILGAIAHVYGENVNHIKDPEVRAAIVRSLLAQKKTLLIFDNVESNSKLNLLMPNSSSCAVIMTSRYRSINHLADYPAVVVEVFNVHEVVNLLSSILGTRYTTRNKDKLLQIAQMVGNLPLAVHLLAKQLLQEGQDIKRMYMKLQREHLRLEQLAYEDRNLRISLDLCFQELNRVAQHVFISLGVFAGHDFASPAVAAINNFSLKETENILLVLVGRSLVNTSIKGRFRLHPLVKLYAEEKIRNQRLYLKAADYYVHFLERQNPHRTMQHFPAIIQEYDSIMFLFNTCCKLNQWHLVLGLWQYFGIFLWHSGNWYEVGSLGVYAVTAAKKLHDEHALAWCYIRELSWLYFWQGEIKKALYAVQSGLRLANKFNDTYLIAYGNQRLGMIYQRYANYDGALKVLKRALQLFKKLKKTKHIGDTYLYLGHVLRKKGDMKRSKINYSKSLHTALSIADCEGIPIALYYLGENALLDGKLRKATAYFTQALTIDRRNGRRAGEAWNKWGLGLVALAKKNFEQAIVLFNEARTKYKRLGMQKNIEQVDKSMELALKHDAYIDKSLLFEVS